MSKSIFIIEIQWTKTWMNQTSITALEADATLVGVNQRDLVTFQVDHKRAVRRGGVIPDSAVKVAESGVRGADDARLLEAAGYGAVLVGESLVTSDDPKRALVELIG